jgi:class 3 adenylate cyclase
MSELPTGIVTFLFTDIEGSTRLLQELGEAYGPLLEGHHAILRSAIAGAGGMVVQTEGDSLFAAFKSPAEAVSAAAVAQRTLASTEWPHGTSVRVRMGLHTGQGELGGDSYVGIDVSAAG